MTTKETEYGYFPHVIDSSMLSTFRACPRKYKLEYVDHWKPKNNSIDLIAGGAFASALETARKEFYALGRPANDSIAAGGVQLLKSYGQAECPPENPKSCDRMLGALEYYFSEYPLGKDGATPIRFGDDGQGIELSFAAPLDEIHPTTGDPIIFCGRMDMVADFSDGLYLFDDKTTKSLGARWQRQWDLRSQFTAYCWGTRIFDLKPKGMIVRGISILKTKYETMQVLTLRENWEIERWYRQLLRDLTRMKRMWLEDYWDFDLDGACTQYNGCMFAEICKKAQPEIWLPMYCEKRVWDPLGRKELSIEEYEGQWK